MIDGSDSKQYLGQTEVSYPGEDSFKGMLLVIPDAEVISKYFSNNHHRSIPINESFGEDDCQTIKQMIANQAFRR